MADLSKQGFYKRGELTRDCWESGVDHQVSGWEHTELRSAELDADAVLDLPGAGVEKIIVPLSGSATVTYTESGVENTVELAERSSGLNGTADVLYLSSEAADTLTGSGRIAVATSPTANVMAGPSPERAWIASDDPEHAWVRNQWAGQPIHARLPYEAE